MFKKILIKNGAIETLKKIIFSGAMITAGAISYGIVKKLTNGNTSTIEPKHLMLTFAGVESIVFYVSYKILYGVPFTFKIFSTRVLLSQIEDQYFLLTQLRAFDKFGFTYQNGLCDNLRPENRKNQLVKITNNLRLLNSIGKSVKPGTQDYIGYLTMSSYFNSLVRAYELKAWPIPLYFIYPTVYPVNQLFGAHLAFIDSLDRQQINGKSDINEFINRITASTEYIDGLLEDLFLREGKQMIPPSYVIDGCLNQITTKVLSKIDDASDDYFLIKKLRGELEKLKYSESKISDILKRVNQAIDNNLVPSFSKLEKYLIQLKDDIKPGDGIWRLPNGDELYTFLIKFYTSSNLTAEDVHEIGQKETKRIRQEIIDLFKDEYPEIQSDFPSVLRSIADDERFKVGPDGKESTKENILQGYRQIIEDLKPKLSEYFDRVPMASCNVEAVPNYKESEAPLAYYMPPPLDRSKPGVFYANLRDTSSHTRVVMKDLCFHEAIPGHHFQISLSQEEKSIDVFRRNMIFIAYAEGWGLYCERLASEAGWYDDKYERLGHLVAEMWRALRLVIDTGIHSSKYKWTHEQSVKLMYDNTYLALSDIKNEIDRYVVFPGQACAYYIGLLKIIELRELSRSRLQDKFSIKEFHGIVLGSGAIPLDVLEIVVNNWISSKLK